MSDYETAIIEEFRAGEGRVGGHFDGWTLLLLHHTGAETGEERVSPLAYQPVDGGWAIFASGNGGERSPSWYHNLVANPEAAVEIGTDTVAVTARVVAGDERDRIWTKQKSDYPQYATYERKTDRVIPVIVLEPRG